MRKHSLGVIYTPAEIEEMYGKEFFKKPPQRPIKLKITNASQFDAEHQQTYAVIAAKIQEKNIEPVQVWACGSRVHGYWWTPEEDPSNKGSDWDIWTDAKVRPDKKEIVQDLPGVRIDWTTGKNPPTHAVRVF